MTNKEMAEKAKLRPKDFGTRTFQEQWEIDQELGILDWDGTTTCTTCGRSEVPVCPTCYHALPHGPTPGTSVPCPTCRTATDAEKSALLIRNVLLEKEHVGVERHQEVFAAMDDIRLALIRTYYHAQTPHRFVPTYPYVGCDVCRIGPGAFFHNDYEVARWEQQLALWEAEHCL